MIQPTHQWNRLIEWLQSHGMFTDGLLMEPRERQGAGFGLYTKHSLPPSTPLCTIPGSALLNIQTLSPYYPRSDPPLTAVQLISLHLALYQPKELNDGPSDLYFGPYISVLPRDFTWHPLTWLYKQSHRITRTREQRLLDILPKSVLDNLNELLDKFRTDWKRASDFLGENQNLNKLFQSDNKEMQYLWAWLNVNTRCIYHRICSTRSDPDNISLCPLLDFANHTSSDPHMVVEYGTVNNIRPKGRQTDITLVSPTSTRGENEEMYLVYGAHSNKRLFVEYGFVNQVSAEIIAKGEVLGEVDVRWYMENLFRERGNVGEWMKKILTDEGYWGDWTMHAGPGPAHPSFRLMTALRLYHAIPLVLEGNSSESLLDRWKGTILGTREIVSEEIEELWRKTLIQICDMVEVEAKRGMERAQHGTDGGWEGQAKERISQLWLEEVVVAREVRKSVEAGIPF